MDLDGRKLAKNGAMSTVSDPAERPTFSQRICVGIVCCCVNL